MRSIRLLSAAAVAALFVANFAAHDAHAAPLNVDFRSASNNGGGPGALQTGFVEFAHDGSTAHLESYANDELAGTGNSVGVTARADFWRSRPAITGGPFLAQSPLLSDGMLDNAQGTMTLMFTNLLNGTYNLKLYHHEPQFGTGNAKMDILVNNGFSPFTAATDVPTTGGTSPGAVSTSEFLFEVVGGQPVTITFDFTGETFVSEVVAVAGFELSLIPPVPEPSTALMALLGLVGLRTVRRRKARAA